MTSEEERTRRSSKEGRTRRSSKEERIAQQQADIALRHAAEYGDAAEIARLLAGKPNRQAKAKKSDEGYDGDKSGAEDDSSHDPNATRASVTAVDGAEWLTAAHKACQNGSAPCLELLIAAGTNVNAEDKLGRTPAWYAARQGSSQCLEALYKAGADLQKMDSNEITPIFMANANGHTHACSVLNGYYKRPLPAY